MSLLITKSGRLFKRYEERKYAAVVLKRDELLDRLNELPPKSLILWLDPRVHKEIGVFARFTNEPVTKESLGEAWRNQTYLTLKRLEREINQ